MWRTTARSISIAVFIAAVSIRVIAGDAGGTGSASCFADAFAIAFQPPRRPSLHHTSTSACCHVRCCPVGSVRSSSAAVTAAATAATARNKVRLAAEAEAQEENTTAPSKIDSIILDLHESSLKFRIVVIGNGAILESTSTLGPHMAESTSPKTGERLVTLASDDRSFEFHLKPDTIAKVVFAESKKPDNGKTLRIVRMLREDGGPICSLILADGSDEAVSWYKAMTIRYGYEVRSGDD
mmetsp:Transcript_17935/g.51394  ORF Transcript_17935/g.51394 Transcript_17935/m.51394 type:complete len:239 (-) Transcript_17935:164-880(-)